MAWLEAHQSLSGHPKTRKAALKLGVPKPQLIGHLFLLWWWALDYAQDGDVTRFGPDDLALAAEWDGDPEAFAAALVDCRYGDGAGFLERRGDGRLVIHDWWEYAGKLIERRREDAERKKAGRRTDVQTPPSISSAAIHGTSAGHPADTRTDGVRTQPTNQQTDNSAPTERAGQASAPDPAPATRAVPKPVKDRRPLPKPIQAANALLHLNCDETERGLIVAAVGSDPESEALWERCLTEWRARRYRPQVRGPLDWYEAGGPPEPERRGRNGTYAGREPPIRSVAQLAAQRLRAMQAAEHAGGGDGRNGYASNGGGVAAGLSGIPDRHGAAHEQLPAPRGR